MCRKSLCHKRQPNSSGTFFYAVRTTTVSGFYRESKKGHNRHSYNFRPKHFDSVKFNPTRHFVKEVYRKGEKELEHARPHIRFQDVFFQAHSGRAIRHADGISKGIHLHHPLGIPCSLISYDRFHRKEPCPVLPKCLCSHPVCRKV